MNRISCFSVLVLMVGSIIPSNSVAGASGDKAPASAPALTLDALVAEALEKNPELQFYEAELAAAKAVRKTAGAPPNPELNGGIGQKTVRGNGLSAEGIAWSISIAQPFEWPGRLPLRKAIANRDVELAELGLGRFRTALSARIRSLGFSLFAAHEKAAASREVADRFQALREVLLQRDPAGLTPLLETRVIEATELTLQRSASAAALTARTALIELNQLRGAPLQEPLSVPATDLVFRPGESAEALATMARTNNFELRLRAVELAQQGFRTELAKNERFPSVSIGPAITEERAGERERIIGLGVSLPLPLWNRNAGNIEAAKARQIQAEVSLQVAAREIERQIVEAVLKYETKLREMGKWRPDSVRYFKEAAELADRHYRLGAVPISTYLELQKQYLEAVEALLETKREALEAAEQIRLLTGLETPLVTVSAKEESR